MGRHKLVITLEIALEKAKAAHPDLDFSKVTTYCTDKEHIWTIGCPKHGYYNYFSFNLIYRKSRGCKECEREIKDKYRTKMYLHFSRKKNI